MNKHHFLCLLLFVFPYLFSCVKKTDDPVPTLPVTVDPVATNKNNLTGNGSVKYWQTVSLIRVNSFGGNNLYLTEQACAVDNYIVFFDNGDYEERSFGQKCFADERLITGSAGRTWSFTGTSKFKINGINGFSMYEITDKLFGSEVTVTELTPTRFKGYRLTGGDTIKFVLSAVPM